MFIKIIEFSLSLYSTDILYSHSYKVMCFLSSPIFFSRCVYVLPEDVHTVDANTVPYELDVDIVQDCSNFTYEIADVFDVIKTNCDDYAGVLRKVQYYIHGVFPSLHS